MGFTYNWPEPVSIEGDGGRDGDSNGPVITDSAADPSGDTVLSVRGSSASSISGVTVVVPAPSGSAAVGIDTTGTVRNALVRAAPNVPNFSVGVLLEGGGSIVDSDIDMPTTVQSFGVLVAGAGTSLDGARIEAARAYQTSSAASSGTARHLELTSSTAAFYVTNGDIVAEDVLMRTRSADAGSHNGVLLAVSSGAASLTLDHVTMVGPSGADGIAIEVSATGTGTALLAVRNAVVSGYAKTLQRQAASGAMANLTTDYSDYGDAVGVNAGPGAITETSRLNVGPGFLSATDFHLRADSPLVDAGDPDGLTASESATDASGQPRIADGNGDCVARRDIGAFEFTPGPRAPRAVAVVLPSALLVGAGAGFDASGSCDPDGDALTFAWSFDDGATATGAVVQHAFSSPGPHSGTVTVTDATGRATTATAYMTTTALPPPFAGVTIAKQTVRVSKKGVAKVKVKCPKAASGSCDGTLKISAKLRKRTTIGSKRFKIRSGATRGVSVKLSSAARARLRTNGRLNAIAIGTAKDASGLTKTGSGTLVLTFAQQT